MFRHEGADTSLVKRKSKLLCKNCGQVGPVQKFWNKRTDDLVCPVCKHDNYLYLVSKIFGVFRAKWGKRNGQTK